MAFAPAPVALPVLYAGLGREERRLVRSRYARLQDGLCAHCQAPLEGEPETEIFTHRINWDLFPPGFLDHPVHLHHSHETGLTLGAVHARCNAVLFQFHGE